MRGVSRASYAELSERLSDAVSTPITANRTGDELFEVVRLLDREHALRRALADPSKPGAEKAAIVNALLRGKVTHRTEGLVAQAAEAHWSSSSDLADAIEELAIEAYVIAAQFDGKLDDLEDDLFRFSRVIAAQPDLRAALTGPVDTGPKGDLLNTLLDGKISGPALSLITQVVLHPRGRSPQAALDLSAAIAARRREQLIAVVRVATELSADQRRRLSVALRAAYGQGVHVNVVLDPAVVGGMSVQIGDELIDGTAASRLADVRRRLAG
jgi:F-type H+-transporting ATPase subunit delta